MTTSRLLILLFALGAMSFAGCGRLGPGDDDDAADDDDSVGDDDDSTGGDPTVVTIAQIHAGEVNSDTFVTIENVVVSTPMLFDEDDNEGAFWLSTPDGGENSGLYVFTFYDVVDELDGNDDAAPGDVITITGTYIEAFDYGLPELRLTNASNVTVTGSTTLPTPHLVDAADIADGFADSSLWGAVVQIVDAVADNAPTWDSYLEWTADDVIVVDDFYYADVEAGYEIASLSGVLHPNYGDASLFPRWHDDIDFTYPGCDDSWGADSIQGARCRVVDEDTEVTIDGLVVTSPAPFFGNAFFVQDIDAVGNFAAAEVYAIFDDLEIPDIGDVVNVSGDVENFKGMTEIVVFNGSDVVKTGANRAGELTPLVLASACDITEEHEGMLVSVASVEVGELDYNFYPVDGCPKIGVSSLFWPTVTGFEDDTAGSVTITDLVGIVGESFDEMSINPRDNLDWGTWPAASSSVQ
mgnify:CR=1 FL=1